MKLHVHMHIGPIPDKSLKMHALTHVTPSMS